MVNVLMISLDDTILTGKLGDNRARHEDYARRIGEPLRIVVCTTQTVPDLHTEWLRAVPTRSRSRLAYVIDGVQAANTLLAGARPDVITTQDALLTGVIGLRLRSALHVPVIVQDHTTIAEGEAWARESLRNRALRRLARFVLPKADAVRVVNTDERESCIRLGCAPEDVHVIPVATDLARFSTPDRSIDWRARLGIGPKQPVALWVGRPVPFKNLALLLQAFQIIHDAMPDSVLTLAGDFNGTPYPDQIRAMGLMEAVRLPGRVNFDELPSLYQAASVYVHSSFYEGAPRVQFEAAAAGLPIVSTDVIGARDIVIHGETGYLVPLQPGPFADAALQLLRHPDRARAMGQRAQADITNRFDPERLRTEWIDLWRAVAARGIQP
jgi:glycosyltransferase involved in cell wall biosynthesis